MDAKLENSLGASSDAKTPGFSINTSTGDRLARSYFRQFKAPTDTKKARLDYEKKKTEKKICGPKARKFFSRPSVEQVRRSNRCDGRK